MRDFLRGCLIASLVAVVVWVVTMLIASPLSEVFR